MKIIEYPITKNRCYNDGRFMTVKGLMLHSVGCSQPNAKVFADSENNASANAAVHAILQADGTVYHTLPWNKRGWHAGVAFSGATKTANNTHIGVEMTEPAGIKYDGGATWHYTDEKSAKEHIFATYKVAVELFAYLCKMYNLDPLADGVIISHAEGYKRGIACGHADVEHIWDKVGLTMDGFRKDVAETLKGKTDYTSTVNVLYLSLLGRKADAKGIETWGEVIANKGENEAYKGIANSTEGKQFYIKSIYPILLGRKADDAGLKNWTKKSTREEIYNGIVNSAEYKKKN